MLFLRLSWVVAQAGIGNEFLQKEMTTYLVDPMVTIIAPLSSALFFRGSYFIDFNNDSCDHDNIIVDVGD